MASLGQPSKFQRVSRLAFVTAATSLTEGQPNFARCLAVSWAATLYIHFRELLPLTEFCQVQNSLYVQVLCSRILAALPHGTPASGVSQLLRRGTRNGITELSQRAPPIFGTAACTLGIGPHSSFLSGGTSPTTAMTVSTHPGVHGITNVCACVLCSRRPISSLTSRDSE